MTGRVFGASLKPAWNEQKIQEFLNKTNGDITVFIINHDKDVSEAGEKVETHTHIYLEYSNPRKITTVSNLLEVEANFVEVVRNKKGYLRYLTHMDEKGKHIYQAEEVYTNSVQEYEITVRGNAMSDREVADMIKQGRGVELLGVVSASKLRTIQSFIHFDASNIMLGEIRSLNKKMDDLNEVVNNVKLIADSFVASIDVSKADLLAGFKLISDSINSAVKRPRIR